MSDEIMPYSQRRAERGAGVGIEPWALETLVEAQRMECAGASIAEIADALGKSAVDVEAHLRPAEARSAARAPSANIGFPHLKGS